MVSSLGASRVVTASHLHPGSKGFPEPSLVDPVLEGPATADEDDRDLRSVTTLEGGIAADIDLSVDERDVSTHPRDDVPRLPAEGTAGAGVEDDLEGLDRA